MWSLETEHLQSMYSMDYIYTFQVFLLEKHQKDCLNLSKGIMFPSGIGFKSTSHWRYRLQKKILEYIVDKTLIKIGCEYIWIWVAIEPKNKQILALSVSKERNMLIAERFLSTIVRTMESMYPVSTDGGGTWYPMACQFLGLKHHIHSPLEKSLIERTMQYIKDRTECFDDFFPCKKINCKLKLVRNWLNLFVVYIRKN